MITTHAWNRGSKKLQAVNPESLHHRRDQLMSPDEVLWIDLVNPTPEEEELIFKQFLVVHPLSLEDVTKLRREPEAAPHFPKVEEFADYLFVVVNPLAQPSLKVSADGAAQQVFDPTRLVTQLSAVLTHNVLITHHYAPLDCVDRLKRLLQRHEAQCERGPDYLFHLVLDNMVDEFVPVLDQIDDTLDELEVEVVQRPQQTLFLRLMHLKRDIIFLRKTLIYEREVLVRLARGEFDLVDERETVYYRNVYDHLVRFTELIESSRDMVADLMQSHLASTANHLNKIMKILTMLSVIILPMTLVAGVYGMNFERLIPDTTHPYGFEIALGMMAACGVVSLGIFYWRNWL